MEDYLIHMTALRKVSWEELRPLLPKMDGKLWLLGKKGSKRLVEHVNQYNPEQWRQACEGGYVYLEHAQHWAFAAELDPNTHLPRLMVPYADAFAREKEGVKTKAPEQLTLNEQPAA